MKRGISADTLKSVAVRSYRWLSGHPRLSVNLIWLTGGLVYLAFKIWSIYSAIPDLPTGELQMVGLNTDGAARYIATGDTLENDHKLRAVVLVVFEQPLKTNGVSIRFEVRKEWIDCAKSKIELEGAGFYNDKGEQVLSRYFERKPEAVKPVDTEVEYLCHPKLIGISPVTGYQAVLDQERAVRAEETGK